MEKKIVRQLKEFEKHITQEYIRGFKALAINIPEFKRATLFRMDKGEYYAFFERYYISIKKERNNSSSYFVCTLVDEFGDKHHLGDSYTAKAAKVKAIAYILGRIKIK